MLRFLILVFSCLPCLWSSSVVTPLCYGDEIDLPAPARADCLYSMANFKNDPFYTVPQTYGIREKYPRDIPIKWRHKSCMNTITALDASKTDKFALSDTMSAFAAIQEICIKRKKPGQGFGGQIPIGHGQEFYALISYNPDFRTAVDVLQMPSNRTENSTIPQSSQAPGSPETS